MSKKADTTNSSKNRNVILTLIVLALIFAITAVLVVILLSIQRKPEKAAPTLSADQVVIGVIKKMNYTNLTPISQENISRYYEIPKNAVSDYAMYISGKSGTDIELTCFKVVNEDGQWALHDAVNLYLSEKSNTSRNVSQTFYSKTDANFPYYFIAVAQDCDAAAKAFEAVLNDSLKNNSTP